MLHRYKKCSGITKISIAHELNRISGSGIGSSAGVPSYINKEADFPGKQELHRTDQGEKNRGKEFPSIVYCCSAGSPL